MPFPNDMNLTVKDRKSPTGLRLHLPAKAMPANKDGKRITVAEYNRQDGFSPGQSIVVRVKGLNTASAFKRSRLVPLGDLGQSFAKRAGVVVINARTGKRQLIYAELDANAKSAKDKMLLIHPGENFDEGARYIVALRGLRTSSGKKIKPSKGFTRAQGRQGAEAPAQALQGHLQDAQARGHREVEPDPRVGLHGRLREGADRAHAPHPQRRVRPARRPQPRRRQDRGQRAAVHDHQGRRQPRRADPAPHLRHVHRALLPQRAGLPARREVQLREQGQGRAPGPAVRQHADREVRVRDPGRRGDHSRARRAVRPRPARRPRRDRRDRCEGHVAGARLRVLRDGVERHVGGGHPERDQAAGQPLQLRLARRPQPAGLPQPDVPRPAADPPAGADRQPRVRRPRRPVAAVLRRQQPGRHPRHRADRDGARLHARGARRARDQLLGAADPQLELGHLRRRSSTPATRARPTGRSCCR